MRRRRGADTEPDDDDGSGSDSDHDPNNSPTNTKAERNRRKRNRKKEKRRREREQAEAAAQAQQAPSTRLIVLTSVLVFVAVFVTYRQTLYTYISGGDSGELVVTTCNWGVAHPPGYPLFTMLGAVFARLWPEDTDVSWAYRVNMLSALQGSLAAAFMHATTTLLTDSVFPGLLASMGFAFSRTVWWYSIQGEVFALNHCLLAALALLAVLYFRRPSLGVACLGAFVSGLTLTNQHTTVFPVAVTVLSVVYSLYERQVLFLPRYVVCLTASLLAGLSPYLYLPYAAFQANMDSWGDQRTLGGFLHHFLRREYGTFQLAADQRPEDNPGMVVRLGVYMRVLFTEEAMYVLPVLAVVGAVALILQSRHRRAGLTLLIGWATYVLVFHYLANLDPTRPLYLGVQARFWQQSNLYVFIWAAVGLHFVLRKWRRVMALASLALVVFQLVQNLEMRDFSHLEAFRVQGERVLASFPHDSIVLLNGDLNNNILKYPNQCEGVRPDLRLISLQLLTWEWFVPLQARHYDGVKFPGQRYHPNVPGGFSLAQFLDANMPKFKVFLCGPFKDGDPSHEARYTTVPFGQCDQIVRKDEVPKGKELAAQLRQGWRALPTMEQLGPFHAKQYTLDSWEYVLYSDNWIRRSFLTSYISFQANQDLKNRPLLRLARDAFDELLKPASRQVLEAHGRLKPTELRDAGIIYGQWSNAVKKKKKQSTKAARRMLELWGEYVALQDDPAIAPFVEQHINPYVGGKVE